VAVVDEHGLAVLVYIQARKMQAGHLTDALASAQRVDHPHPLAIGYVSASPDGGDGVAADRRDVKVAKGRETNIKYPT
jgi:hypothetical protein